MISDIYVKIKVFITYIILNSFASSHICPCWLRRIIYNWFGHHVEGKIHSECFMGYGPKGHLTLGKGSYCNFRCFFDLGDDITIGDRCSIAYGVTFCNSTHEIGDKYQRASKGITGAITVGDGCWIGANSTILPDVNIGEGCIIAASSLVKEDCHPHGLYAGVPAKLIRKLD